MDSILIVDEVSTGAFRTGPMLCVDTTSIKPDIVILAKGLTAGLTPMSIVAVAESVANRVRHGMTNNRLPGSTQAGDPVGCAAALATLEYLQSAESRSLRTHTSKLLGESVQAMAPLPGVRRIEGRGHLWGVQLEVPRTVEPKQFTSMAAESGLRHGLLLHPLSVGTLPVMPSLTISPSEVLELSDRLGRTIEDLGQRLGS